jgi:hypothetical protein
MAQNRSRIIGTVTTEEGAVIADVTVTINSDALIARTMATTTNERGMYRFVLLPVGTYKITFEKEGYQTVEQSDLDLDFDRTLAIDMVLKPAAFEEVLTITGEAPLVDKTSSSISTKLDLEVLQNVPNTRNVWNLPNLTAGFTDDSALGAPERGGNALNIDGAVVHDPSTKTVFASINLEAVEQIDVAMFGSNAEYHSFTGASLNMVTKSGGNDFSGEANYFHRDTEWVSDNTGDYQQYGITLPVATKEYDPNFALGGPIIRDKIWFFGNYNWAKTMTDRELIDKPIVEEWIPKRHFLKFSSRWDDRNISYFSYTYYYRDRSHRVAYGDWNTNYEGSMYWQVSDGNTYILQHSFVLNDNMILEGRFSKFTGGFDLKPRVAGDTLRDWDTGFHLPPGTLSRFDLYDRPRDTILGTMNYYNDDLNGQHSFKFGVEYENNKGNRHYSHTRNIYYRNGDPYRWYDYGEYISSRKAERIGAYAQDSWSVNERLTINIGFRIDRWWASAGDPDNALGIAGTDTFRKMTDPAYRIGFAYDLFGDGKTVLRAFAGRYYEGVVSGNINEMVSYVPPTRRYHWDGSNWYLYSEYGGSDPDAYSLDPDMTNQYTEGFMVGLERELRPNLSAGVTFVYKRDKDMMGEILENATWREGSVNFSNENGSYSGTYYFDYREVDPILVTNPKKGMNGVLEDPFREYYGLIFDVAKRMSNNWSGFANYVYSYNVGNTSQGYGTIQGYDFWSNPNDFINAGGRMPEERPHVLKVGGTYIAPFDINLSPVVTFMSGKPYGLYYRPSGQDDSILIKKIDGEDRNDSEFNIDFRIEKFFMFKDRYRVGVLLDVFNVLNADYVTDYVSTRINHSAFLEPENIARARYWQVGVRLLF